MGSNFFPGVAAVLKEKKNQLISVFAVFLLNVIGNNLTTQTKRAELSHRRDATSLCVT